MTGFDLTVGWVIYCSSHVFACIVLRGLVCRWRVGVHVENGVHAGQGHVVVLVLVGVFTGSSASRRGPGVARGQDEGVLCRLAYLSVTNTFAVLRLLPMSDRDKDVEILALRHQLAVLQRHLGQRTVTFTPADRAFLAALLHPVPRQVLRRLQLLLRPDTILR